MQLRRTRRAMRAPPRKAISRIDPIARARGALGKDSRKTWSVVRALAAPGPAIRSPRAEERIGDSDR